MSTLIRTFGFTTLALAGLSIHAGDFAPLMRVARNTWPEKTTIGVLCDYTRSAGEVQELAEAAGPATSIRVVDIQRRDQLIQGVRCMLEHKPDYVVLLTRDHVLPDYSIEATQAVRYLASFGVPTISTASVAMKQGAVFALGDRTRGELLVCKQPIGTISVALPEPQSFMASYSNPGTPAPIQVASIR